MPATIRESAAQDAQKWLDLLKSSFGEDHPAKQIYDVEWIKGELTPNSNSKTWLAEQDGNLQASLTVLAPFPSRGNAVCNLGRNLFRAESYQNGAAETLLKKLVSDGESNGFILVVRVMASDKTQQTLFENAGFVCAGFQPFKHIHRSRENALFYVRVGRASLESRLSLSESLPQVSELANLVLNACHVSPPTSVRDGVTGYPLKTEIEVQEATADDYELWRTQAESGNPPVEVSGLYNAGHGFFRLPGNQPLKSILGLRQGIVVAGIRYFVDEQDRCVRVVDSFTTDDLSMGALLGMVVKRSQEQHNAVYVEVDVLITAPRFMKSAEQLGFVPVAYLPAFFTKDQRANDVIKLVKLNTSYALENNNLTANAQAVVKVVDYNYQDQKIGVAIINLLARLPIFEGLGDGELRKIARLFTQKLYRGGEKVFNKGDQGNEAYIVMRGQIDICLDEKSPPVASVLNGQIFGEQAFLDGAARGGLAVASQPSILLVMQRTAFNDLVQREPHLGMVVIRNIAMDLSNKLRRANQNLSGPRR
jgi:CRP/FNR family transcriptional regulator, cyclic AMP receptor protein